MKFDHDVGQKYKEQWVDTNGILQQKDMLIVQVWAKANVSTKAPKEIKVPNGDYCYKEINEELITVGNFMQIIIRVSHQIVGIYLMNH